MIILGVDPGLAITGYGLVEENAAGVTYISSGCIRTAKGKPVTSRLEGIFKGIMELIEQHHPHSLALEKLYFSRNTTTALQVGEARGIVILAAAVSNTELFEYTPLQVKQAVTGYGRAEKIQVQAAVRMLLRLEKMPPVDDEADALAVALCHQQRRRMELLLKGEGRA